MVLWVAVVDAVRFGRKAASHNRRFALFRATERALLMCGTVDLWNGPVLCVFGES